MANIQSYPVLNFSGGVRRDKSSLEMDRTELLDARNVEIDEQGRIKIRRGSFQLGQTLANTIENSFVWERVVGGSTPLNSIYQNDSAGNMHILRTARLTTALTTASATIVATSNSNFSASGTVEIEGDLITYSALVGGTDFTVSGSSITVAHAAGASVNQWVALTGEPSTDTRGVSYTVVGNIMIFGGVNLGYIDNDDGTTISAVGSEPSILNLVTYRDRAYGSGSGGVSLGDPRRVYFSNRGDGTTWTTVSDFFDVNDTTGSGITALKVLSDRLLIFKTNATFTYDEVELKQRLTGIGAWNHKTPVEIDGLVYTFCPRGIFQTNGSSAKPIGELVRQYWENFQPEVDASTERVVTNTFGAKFKHYYLVYIHNVTDPNTTNDVVLCYNTKNGAWSVWPGYTNIRHFLGTDKYRFGDRPLQFRPALFMGDTGGKYFRCFETRYVDRQSTPVNQGVDVFTDLVSNTALSGGTPVSATIETPLYDMGQPSLFKKPKRLRVYAERGMWSFEYRVENEDQITQYKPLGVVTKSNQSLDLPKECAGYRVGLRISAVNTSSQSILNGFVFEDINVDQRANK